MGAPGRDIISVTCFSSLFFLLPLFRSLNLRPQRTSTWPGYLADSENNKKDFLGLTSIGYGQAEWERKIQIQTGRRQRLVLQLYIFFKDFCLGHWLSLPVCLLSLCFYHSLFYSLSPSTCPAEVFTSRESPVISLNSNSLDKTFLCESFDRLWLTLLTSQSNVPAAWTVCSPTSSSADDVDECNDCLLPCYMPIIQQSTAISIHMHMLVLGHNHKNSHDVLISTNVYGRKNIWTKLQIFLKYACCWYVNKKSILRGIKGTLWSFLVNIKSDIYIRHFSLKLIVLIFEV